jgi:formylglycine-generating enzyme required for sulfatase activity
MVLVGGGTVRHGAEVRRVEPFLIDLHEVTNERFDRFIDATGATIGYRPARVELRAAQAPATGVNHVEARAFAAWAGNKRLPSSDEWTVAAAFDPARDALTVLPWGDEATAVELPALRFPAAVGTYENDRSHAGVIGMGGSVRELCELGDDSMRPDPTRGVVRGGTQVVRGNRRVDAAIAFAREVEATARHEEGQVGFRCVKSLIPPYQRR